MNNLIYSNNNDISQEDRSSDRNSQKKFDFKKMKNNTCKSLNEVELFLNNLHRFGNYIKLYKILK